MAWIESHQSLSKHRKLLKTSGRLSVDRHTVIGHLMDLWWWGLDNIPSDGFMGHISDEEIAIAAEWSGNATEFVNTLIDAGFIDENEDGRWLHDWYDYAGKLLDKREKEKERSKERRSTAKRPTVDQRSKHTKTDGSFSAQYRTVPNSTEPNKDPAVGEAVGIFEQTFGRFPNSVQIEDLSACLEKGMEVSLVEMAMRKTKRADKPISYLFGILNSMLDQNIFTVADAEAEQARRETATTRARESPKEQAKPEQDPRYAAFYELFPNG